MLTNFFFNIRFDTILRSGLQNCFCTSGFSDKNFVCIPHILQGCQVHLILLDFITLRIFYASPSGRAI